MFFMGTHKKTYENISHKKTYEKTLPMRERRDWHILKAAHKAFYSEWPLYVSLERSERTRVLRSNAEVNLVLPLIPFEIVQLHYLILYQLISNHAQIIEHRFTISSLFP
jgi:hypothetical protein